ETSAEKVLANGEDAVNRKAHKALTTLEDWTAAQVRCQARARRDNGEYPLTGTAGGAEGGQGLHGQRPGLPGRTYPRYRCSNKACGGGSSILARGSFPDGTPRGLEDFIRETFRANLAIPGWAAQFTPGDLHAVTTAVEQAQHELDVFASSGVRPSSRLYLPTVARLEGELDAAQAAYQEVVGQEADLKEVPSPDELDDPEQFQLALRLIDRIIIRRGRGTLAQRVRIRWRKPAQDGAGVLAA